MRHVLWLEDDAARIEQMRRLRPRGFCAGGRGEPCGGLAFMHGDFDAVRQVAVTSALSTCGRLRSGIAHCVGAVGENIRTGLEIRHGESLVARERAVRGEGMSRSE